MSVLESISQTVPQIAELANAMAKLPKKASANTDVAMLRDSLERIKALPFPVHMPTVLLFAGFELISGVALEHVFDISNWEDKKLADLLHLYRDSAAADNEAGADGSAGPLAIRTFQEPNAAQQGRAVEKIVIGMITTYRRQLLTLVTVVLAAQAHMAGSNRSPAYRVCKLPHTARV
jgi:hypothetical protein